MAWRRNAIAPHWYAARLGDLGGDFRRRQYAAMAGLGPLRQFDFDHFHLIERGAFGKASRIKRSVFLAAAKITGSDFPDDVAAIFAVMGAERALPGVMSETAHFGALVEGHDGVGAERAEAHRRNIEERKRIGLTALRSADFYAEILVFDMLRDDRMRQPFEFRLIDILQGAERP